jgi:aromatic ring-cleaving dioxygenase
MEAGVGMENRNRRVSVQHFHVWQRPPKKSVAKLRYTLGVKEREDVQGKLIGQHGDKVAPKVLQHRIMDLDDAWRAIRNLERERERLDRKPPTG